MKPVILTPAQSVEARDNLSLNQAVVVAGVKAQVPAVSFSKSALSEFETGIRNLAPLAQRALRDYYEAQGHEFTDAPQAANEELKPGEQVRVVKDALIVCDRLTHMQRGTIQDRIRDLLAGLSTNLREKAEAGFFDLYSEETEFARDKAIATLAEVGLLYAVLFRQCPVGAPSDLLLKHPGKAETISDVLSVRFAEALKLISDSRSDDGGAGASGGGGDDPALDGDGNKAAASPAATQEKNIWGFKE